MKNGVDPVKRAIELRKSLVSRIYSAGDVQERDNSRILVVDYTNTLQREDTSKVIEPMPNVHTNELVFRTKFNVKELDINASNKYKKKFFDVSQHSDDEIEEFVRKQDFDFPLWFKHNNGFSMKSICDYNAPFTFQVAGCNFHDGTPKGGCLYCFVDSDSNDGNRGNGKTLLSIDDAIDSMMDARQKMKEDYAGSGKQLELKVLRASGGEPTIVLDWILGLWREIGRRNLDLVGQLDSNLSTGPVVDYFEKEGIYEQNILEKLAEHPVKVLTALKGDDQKNLESNVQANTRMETQLYSLKKFIKAGFDIYPQLYNPDHLMLYSFLARMDSEIENFALKLHIGPLKAYGPNLARLRYAAKTLKLNPDEYIRKKQAEWETNYKMSCEVLDAYLNVEHNVGYKEITRSDVRLKCK